MTSLLEYVPRDAEQEGHTRRDFLVVAAGSFAAIGAAFALWPLLDSMNPSADVQALSSTEVDLRPVQLGQRITVQWRGKPVFIDHRTQQEITRAEDGMGFVLSALGLGAGLFGLSCLGEHLVATPVALGTMVGGVLVMALYFWRAQGLPTPGPIRSARCHRMPPRSCFLVACFSEINSRLE